MRIIQMSVLALSFTAFAGCKAINAMDNTETMKTDLAAMKSTTGGMANTTDDMNATTKELKRKASIGEGLKLIDSPENQREFAPPSKGLLAGAKLVGENMSSEELVKFFQAGLKEINNTKPDEMRKDDKGTYTRWSLGGGHYANEFNLRKQVQVVTLKAIAAQIPDAMIQTIVREQFQNGGGAQSDEAEALLMMRASFINDFFLGESVFATGKKLDNMGKLRNAFKYANQLEFLANLPNIERIKFVTTEDAFLPAILRRQINDGEEGCKGYEENSKNPQCKESVGDAPAFNEQLRASIAKPWFKKIARKIDSEMPEDMRGGASPFAREIAEIKAECLRHVDQK